MFFAGVFYTEVIDDEGEYNWAPLVSPEAQCKFHRVVTKFFEALYEEIVC